MGVEEDDARPADRQPTTVEPSRMRQFRRKNVLLSNRGRVVARRELPAGYARLMLLPKPKELRHHRAR
jgi:hypothetical protein